jgi:hypothetical protein
MRRLALVLICSLAALASFGADSTSVAQRIELSFRGAYVLPTNQIVKGDNRFGSKTRSAFGGAVEYSFSFAPASYFGRYYPYAYQGVGVGVTAFDESKVTRTPVNIYVLQGSRIASFSSRLSLDYEWNFGISAGWHKNSDTSLLDYEHIDGFGSNINAYIDLGFKLRYALSNRISLTAGVNFSHFSNGNTDYPNPGVNVLWGRLGLAWNLGAVPTQRRHDWSGYDPHFTYDITAYGAWRKNLFDSNYGMADSDSEMRIIPGHFAVAGLNVNPLWHFNPMFSAGASLDFQYDEGANLSPYYVTSTPSDDPKFYRQPFSHRVMAGLSARAELQMPIFSVNIGIGHSLYAPGGGDLRGWYQMFTLKTFVTRNLYLSTGYRLVRFRTPGNLMLGLGWRFGS